MRDHLHRRAAWAAAKRPPWNYLIVACAVLITILVGVAAAHRFTGDEVATSPLGINGHFTLMMPNGSTVTDRASVANG